MSASTSSVFNFVTTKDDEYISNENGEYLLYNPTTGEMHYTKATPFGCSVPEETGPAMQSTSAVSAESAQLPPTCNDRCEDVIPGSSQVSSFTDAATKCFINILLEKKEKLRNSSIKKKNLWAKISVELKKYNYQLDEHAVERKFRNMKHQFLQIRDNNTKTGRGRKSWVYYTLMEQVFEKDTCVNPKACMASMLPQKGASEYVEPSTSELSGFELIKQVHPQTQMIPESSSASEVTNAVLKRRLNNKENKNNSPACKKVRKRGAQRNDESLTKIQTAIEDSNKIQHERNELLRQLLEKFQ